jgi:hypothetical protein
MIQHPAARPTLTAPSGRWASEVMTADAWHQPQFPDMLGEDGRPASGSMMMGPASLTAPRRYPPPPPPMAAVTSRQTQMSVSLRHARMMRWHQAVEAWCQELDGKTDRERFIVAPPPRPPPFSNQHQSLVGVVDLIAGHRAANPFGPAPPPQRQQQQPRPTGPYTFEAWAAMCHRWWVHVARHFDKLSLRFQHWPQLELSVAPLSNGSAAAGPMTVSPGGVPPPAGGAFAVVSPGAASAGRAEELHALRVTLATGRPVVPGSVVLAHCVTGGQ